MENVAEGLSESYPAVASSVALARHAVSAFAMAAGVRGEQLDAVRLAVSAAVTNVVKHAYPDGPGRVEVSAAIASGELWVLIADDGCGLRADRPSRGHGLGLALIALLSDGFTIARRSSPGVELRMQFALPKAQPAPDEPARDVRAAAPQPAPNRPVAGRAGAHADRRLSQEAAPAQPPAARPLAVMRARGRAAEPGLDAARSGYSTAGDRWESWRTPSRSTCRRVSGASEARCRRPVARRSFRGRGRRSPTPCQRHAGLSWRSRRLLAQAAGSSTRCAWPAPRRWPTLSYTPIPPTTPG